MQLDPRPVDIRRHIHIEASQGPCVSTSTGQGSSCYVKPAGPVRLSRKLDLTIAKSIYDTRALVLELIQNGGVSTNLTSDPSECGLLWVLTEISRQSRLQPCRWIRAQVSPVWAIPLPMHHRRDIVARSHYNPYYKTTQLSSGVDLKTQAKRQWVLPSNKVEEPLITT